MIKHPFPPLFDKDSKILILGSFPSVKSREQCFFYGHKQNRFWKVTSMVLGCNEPKTIDEKKAFLHSNKIALWDVIGACDIIGSSDSSITNALPNDLSQIFENANIMQVFVNGKTAEKYYKIYQEKVTGKTAVCLPSTSPANAAWNVEKLAESWNIIKDYL